MGRGAGEEEATLVDGGLRQIQSESKGGGAGDRTDMGMEEECVQGGKWA